MVSSARESSANVEFHAAGSCLCTSEEISRYPDGVIFWGGGAAPCQAPRLPLLRHPPVRGIQVRSRQTCPRAAPTEGPPGRPRWSPATAFSCDAEQQPRLPRSR